MGLVQRNAFCFPACRQLEGRDSLIQPGGKETSGECSYLSSEILGSLCHSLGCHASSTSTGRDLGWTPVPAAREAGTCVVMMYFSNLSAFTWLINLKLFLTVFLCAPWGFFFLVRDLSRREILSAKLGFYHVEGFCGSPTPIRSIHPHSHTDKAKERVFPSHSALPAQHPILSPAGCSLCVTTKALLVPCLCPCSAPSGGH